MLMLFLTVAMVHIVALMSPGPDFFFVSQTAVSRSRKEAMMGVLGITCGVMVWAGIALLGLHLIIEKMAWLHTLIMVGGGLYLCWMGYQMLRGALKKEAVSAPAPQVELAKSGRSFLERFTDQSPLIRKRLSTLARCSHCLSVITLALPRAGAFLR
ncbi:threonine efflux protein [Escherichia coli]|nr:threonine efflux protein [Escherichia coli]